MRIGNAKKTISEKDVTQNALTALSGKLGMSIVGDNWKNMSDDKPIPRKKNYSSSKDVLQKTIVILDSSDPEDSESFGTIESSSKKSLMKTYHSVKGDAIYLLKEK